MNTESLYPTGPSDYVRIRALDTQTGRGIPLVEFRTNACHAFCSDSAGVVAFFEPTLMHRDVFFHIESAGYSLVDPELGEFELPGRTLRMVPGTTVTVELHRRLAAQRLYRITGQGIYLDSLLLGDRPPVRQPLHNSLVDGQDSVLSTIHRGRKFWIWGDTKCPDAPVEWNFKAASAWSDLPGRGGLDPEQGIDLHYVEDARGFPRQVVPTANTTPPWDPSNLHWIGSLFVVEDGEGRSRLLAMCARIKAPLSVVGRMMLEFDEEKEIFEPLGPDWPASALYPNNHAVRYREQGIEYLTFHTLGGLTRVRADYDAVRDPGAYEAWTCLERGTWLDLSRPLTPETAPVERDAKGRAVWGWKPATSPITQRAQQQLVEARVLRPSETVYHLVEPETGRRIHSHACSLAWNPWRRRWVLILSQIFGETSMLGELWYAESDRITGPFAYARQIVTHRKYSFYNPLQHPEFFKKGGREVFFEGTYTVWFSGVQKPTPRYDYNQILYKLDLADERTVLPVAVYRDAAGPGRFRTAPEGDAADSKPAETATPGNPNDRAGASGCLGEPEVASEDRAALLDSRAIAFYALDRPRADSVPVYEIYDDHGLRLECVPAETEDPDRPAPPSLPDGTLVFHALARHARDANPEVVVPLYEFRHEKTGRRVYATAEADASPRARRHHLRASKPLCLVWRCPHALANPKKARPLNSPAGGTPPPMESNA